MTCAGRSCGGHRSSGVVYGPGDRHVLALSGHRAGMFFYGQREITIATRPISMTPEGMAVGCKRGRVGQAYYRSSGRARSVAG